jgi:hypothetical protein
MPVDEVLAAVASYPSKLVEVTGASRWNRKKSIH